MSCEKVEGGLVDSGQRVAVKEVAGIRLQPYLHPSNPKLNSSGGVAPRACFAGGKRQASAQHLANIVKTLRRL